MYSKTKNLIIRHAYATTSLSCFRKYIVKAVINSFPTIIIFLSKYNIFFCLFIKMILDKHLSITFVTHIFNIFLSLTFIK